MEMAKPRLGADTRSRLGRYRLRTTDVDGARAFYRDVIGHSAHGVEELPAAAIARGARPHWLGQIDARPLGGVEAAVMRFVERGATWLGPPGPASVAVLRDPGGAIVGLTDTPDDADPGVAWHQLNTRDVAAAASTYEAVCGWSFGDDLDLGALGRHRRFALELGAPPVGIVSDVEGRPGVHTHWLFFFAVPSLDTATSRVRDRGGIVIGPLALPNGARVAACDDAQGAAFGLIEASDAARLAGTSA